MLVIALVKNKYQGVCFGLATTESTMKEPLLFPLQKKGADFSGLFEGGNCHVPPSATRDVF